MIRPTARNPGAEEGMHHADIPRVGAGESRAIAKERQCAAAPGDPHGSHVMISALEDAWTWYESVRTLTKDMERLGRLFWDRSEWADALTRDNRFRSVTEAEITDRVRTVHDDLDDLGVLL